MLPVQLRVAYWNRSQIMEDQIVIIGERLRALREEKKFSQGVVEERTGLLRCYVSRVENGHTVPAVETLEKMARALEVSMYRLFHDGEVKASIHKLKPTEGDEWGNKGKEADYLSKLRRLLAKMEPGEPKIVAAYGPKVARD